MIQNMQQLHNQVIPLQCPKELIYKIVKTVLLAAKDKLIYNIKSD